jgi:hypothetical protein
MRRRPSASWALAGTSTSSTSYNICAETSVCSAPFSVSAIRFLPDDGNSGVLVLVLLLELLAKNTAAFLLPCLSRALPAEVLEAESPQRCNARVFSSK